MCFNSHFIEPQTKSSGVPKAAWLMSLKDRVWPGSLCVFSAKPHKPLFISKTSKVKIYSNLFQATKSFHKSISLANESIHPWHYLSVVNLKKYSCMLWKFCQYSIWSSDRFLWVLLDDLKGHAYVFQIVYYFRKTWRFLHHYFSVHI